MMLCIWFLGNIFGETYRGFKPAVDWAGPGLELTLPLTRLLTHQAKDPVNQAISSWLGLAMQDPVDWVLLSKIWSAGYY